MGIWEDFQRNSAVRNGTQYQAPVQPVVNNAAEIAQQTKDFPTFSKVADYFAGPATEPRFNNFSAFVKNFGGYDEGFNGTQGAKVGSPGDSPIAGGHGDVRLGGNIVPEADDFGPGEGMDFENDFTEDDIVDAIAPKAPGKKKMTKPQAKKRAAVKRAVKPQVQAKPKAQKYATVDPLNLFGNKNGVNPFGRRNEAMTNARFSGGNVPVKESAFAKSRNPLDLF